MPFRFAMVCEKVGDFLHVSRLVEREMCACADWLEAQLGSCPLWVAEPGGTHFTWSRTKALAQELRIRSHGDFDGDPGKLEAGMVRRALLVMERHFHLQKVAIHGVVLSRDVDKHPERKEGFRQAIDESKWRMPIVAALADRMRECWVLAGFDPRDDAERKRLRDLCSDVSRDPRTDPTCLTAVSNQETHPRHPKGALGRLTGRDEDRERDCWEMTDLSVLKVRGGPSGLTQFLDDIHHRFCPLANKTGMA